MEKIKEASLWGPCMGQSRRSPEQSLEVFWQLRAAGVAWVHGDEDAHRRVQANLLSKEVEPLLLISNCILNAFYLVNKSSENAPSAYQRRSGS